MHPNGTRPIAERFWSKVRKSDGCWTWIASLNTNGYGQIGKGGKRGRPIGAHRVSWELHYGPIPDGLWVLHRCDNPPCVRPDHLFLGTCADNAADMAAKGRSTIGDRNPSRLYPERRARGGRHGTHTQPASIARGERRGTNKLTEAQIVEMRHRHAAGELLEALATHFGVCTSTVSLIVNRKRWSHIP